MLSINQHIRLMEKFITEFPLGEAARDVESDLSTMTRGAPAFGGGNPRPLATTPAKRDAAPSTRKPRRLKQVDYQKITRDTVAR